MVDGGWIPAAGSGWLSGRLCVQSSVTDEEEEVNGWSEKISLHGNQKEVRVRVVKVVTVIERECGCHWLPEKMSLRKEIPGFRSFLFFVSRILASHVNGLLTSSKS
jgi:hypothetical protein